MYDHNLAVLFHDTREGVCDTAQLYTQFPSCNFPRRRVHHIHENLSSSHDDVLLIICAAIYHNVLVVALLRWLITQYSRKLFNLCHMHHLHLHCHST